MQRRHFNRSALALLAGASGAAFGAATSAAATAATTAASPPTPEQLLAATDRVRGGGLPGLQWTLRITAHDPDAGSDMREMVVKAAGDDSVAETTLPARAAGGRLLQQGRNMWYGRPELSKAVSISSRQKMSGPAANGDIASTNYLKDYDAVLLRDDVVNGEAAWVLALTAKSRFVTYDRIEYWISKERWVPLRAGFLTVSGKLFKTAEIEAGNQLMVGGKAQPFVSRMTIRDALQSENVSVLEYRDVRLQAVSRHELSVESLTR